MLIRTALALVLALAATSVARAEAITVPSVGDIADMRLACEKEPTPALRLDCEGKVDNLGRAYDQFRDALVDTDQFRLQIMEQYPALDGDLGM